MALGSISDRFWAQVGGQVGAKLAPKSDFKGSWRLQEEGLGAQDRFLTIFDANLGPTWDQVGAKLAAKSGPKLQQLSKLLWGSISEPLGLDFR